MGIHGLSSSSPMPEDDKFSERQPEQEVVHSNNSIFASFNDTDGKVDVNDVVYDNNAKEGAGIKRFLLLHTAEDWTDALKQKLDFYLKQFNNKMAMKISTQSADDNFDSFTQDAISNFQSADDKNKAEAKAFKQNAEGKNLEFGKNSKSLTKEFKINSMKAVLEDLENGYSGAVVVDKGSIIITYDNEKKAFALKKDGQLQNFDKEKLAQVLSIIAENATSIVGKSKKVVLK